MKPAIANLILVRIRFASLTGHGGVNGKFLKYGSNIEEFNVEAAV